MLHKIEISTTIALIISNSYIGIVKMNLVVRMGCDLKGIKMNYYILDDKDKLQVNRVVELLNNTYWAASRSKQVIEESIKNSICYGVYDQETNILIGFARVITDFATTYYLCDVIVDENYRGMGIGKALIEKITEDSRYAGMIGLLLTKDAHGLYKQYGFNQETTRSMIRLKL